MTPPATRLLVFVTLSIALQVHPALAQDGSLLTNLENEIATASQGWESTVMRAARSLFWILAGIELAIAAVWLAISFFYYKKSVQQDTSKDKALTVQMARWAPLSAVGFGLSLTFAAFDWLMSIEPTWYSTIFGVVIFAGSALSILAVTILVSLGLMENNKVGDAINVEHLHDHAKLMFGFMCFWTYVSFSQWMLIWYAGIPEEAIFFWKRWEGGWDDWEKRLTSELVPISVSQIGRPEDFGNLVCFLASPLSRYITGANYRMDGGQCQSVN